MPRGKKHGRVGRPRRVPSTEEPQEQQNVEETQQGEENIPDQASSPSDAEEAGRETEEEKMAEETAELASGDKPAEEDDGKQPEEPSDEKDKEEEQASGDKEEEQTTGDNKEDVAEQTEEADKSKMADEELYAIPSTSSEHPLNISPTSARKRAAALQPHEVAGQTCIHPKKRVRHCGRHRCVQEGYPMSLVIDEEANPPEHRGLIKYFCIICGIITRYLCRLCGWRFCSLLCFFGREGQPPAQPKMPQSTITSRDLELALRNALDRSQHQQQAGAIDVSSSDDDSTTTSSSSIVSSTLGLPVLPIRRPFPHPRMFEAAPSTIEISDSDREGEQQAQSQEAQNEEQNQEEPIEEVPTQENPDQKDENQE